MMKLQKYNRKLIYFFLTLFLLQISCSAKSYNPANNKTSESFETLKETIEALDVTRIKSQQEINKYYKNNRQTNDIEEYQVFVDFLSDKINEYCVQLYNHNEVGNAEKLESISRLPCQKHDISVEYSSIQEGNILSQEEKIAVLDDEFMDSLGDFDEMLLIEDEIIAQSSRKNNNASASSGGNSGSNSGESSDGSRENKSANSKETSDSKQSESDKETAENNDQEQNQSNKNKSPKGKGKGNTNRNKRKIDETNDDIVARQLKEAAENESDQELKEKLWDEYYKYKQKNIKNEN